MFTVPTEANVDTDPDIDTVPLPFDTAGREPSASPGVLISCSGCDNASEVPVASSKVGDVGEIEVVPG